MLPTSTASCIAAACAQSFLPCLTQCCLCALQGRHSALQGRRAAATAAETVVHAFQGRHSVHRNKTSLAQTNVIKTGTARASDAWT